MKNGDSFYLDPYKQIWTVQKDSPKNRENIYL